MSESQTHSFNNAAGDCTEIKNLEGNLESSADYHENKLEESNQPAVCQIVQVAGGDNQLEKDDNANTKESAEPNNNKSSTILQLQEEILKRTHERDDFRKKLEETELKLSTLQLPQDILANGLTNSSEDGNLRNELENLKSTLTQTKKILEDRERRIVNQECQISALIKQVSSLKEVVAITKDMLNIRNMEVKHLQEDVDKMETKITAERDRHNAMLNKMDAAVRLNADLKKEYQTQLQLFQDLRGKYEEKVTILSEENKALEMAVQAQPAQ